MVNNSKKSVSNLINWWRLHHKPIYAQINSLITFLEDLINNFYILLVQIFYSIQIYQLMKIEINSNEWFYCKSAKTAAQIELARTFHLTVTDIKGKKHHLKIWTRKWAVLAVRDRCQFQIEKKIDTIRWIFSR